MFDFFDQVLGFFEILFSAIKHIFTSLFYLLELVISGASVQGYITPLVPSIIGLSFTIVMAVAIVKLIVGR